MGDAEQPRRSLRDGRHDYRPAGQDVDVPGEVARLVDRDQAAAVRRVADLHRQPIFLDREVHMKRPGAAGFWREPVFLQKVGDGDGTLIGTQRESLADFRLDGFVRHHLAADF